MSEAFGCGFYLGPVWMHQTHKTDHDQRKSRGTGCSLAMLETRRIDCINCSKSPADAKPESERQGQRAAGVDGKLLTELLGPSLHCAKPLADVVSRPFPQYLNGLCEAPLVCGVD